MMFGANSLQLVWVFGISLFTQILQGFVQSFQPINNSHGAFPVSYEALKFTENKDEDSFYRINLRYPGISVLHKDPDIYIVEDFLSSDECDKVKGYAMQHMTPSVAFDVDTGVLVENKSRTSTSAILPQRDAPSIVEKFQRLCLCQKGQLEQLQIVRYTEGQFFTRHTDGYDGPTTDAGFEQSGRLVTVFCYLNDVEKGGETLFTNVGVSIRPCKGMAVVHFPATIGLKEDVRTEHTGTVAIDEKWLLASWVWKNVRTDPEYADELYPSLVGDDLI